MTEETDTLPKHRPHRTDPATATETETETTEPGTATTTGIASDRDPPDADRLFHRMTIAVGRTEGMEAIPTGTTETRAGDGRYTTTGRLHDLEAALPDSATLDHQTG